MASVVSLNVVHAEIPDVGGSVGITAIDKRAVSDRRVVTTDGVAGDKRSDMKHHGHTDQAVYAYGAEDYAWWSMQIGREISAGSFGENLTTVGVDWNAIAIGTVVHIGTSVLQVSTARIPCGTFQRWMDEDQWVKRFTEAGRCGAYLRVIVSGDIGVDDEIVIAEVPSHNVSILDLLRVWTGTREDAQLTRVAECVDTPEDMREKAVKALAL